MLICVTSCVVLVGSVAAVDVVFNYVMVVPLHHAAVVVYPQHEHDNVDDKHSQITVDYIGLLLQSIPFT